MRNETSLANEVRVKLHIKSSQDTQIRNLWMCLNYDQKPSVSHIAEHIRKNFCSASERKSLDESAEPQVKLFLDDFWLPPYENSRLIRENDCVKVELKYDEEEKSYTHGQTTSSCVSKCTSKTSQHVRANEAVKSNDKHVEAYHSAKTDSFANTNGYFRDDRADQYENDYENDEYYYHYYEDEETSFNRPDQAMRYNQQRTEPCDPFEYWSSNIQSSNDQREKAQAKNATYTKTTAKQQQQAKETKTSQQNGKESQKAASTKQTSAANCYKKFAVGSYAHLLNEPAAEQQTKPAAQQKKTENQPQQQQQARRSTDSSVDLDKIASNVNSTGKQKWKNSTKPTQSNGPKHIIFPSTDSESTSSSSSSSDSSDDETTTQKKPTQQQQKQQPAQHQANKKETTAKTNTTQNKKQFYEPTKEEQLNTVNTNRSFTVQNPKTLSEFKKVFNETKLNAPKAEEFTKKQQTQPKQQEKPKQENGKKQTQNQLNTSTDSTSSSSSSSSGSSSPSKRNHRKKSPSPAKIDYEKLAKLEGMPRVHDKLAFQILEISSNFTPEISSYKTGTVTEIDNASNEITIRLNNKYNSVLKRPNKFNVVLDETEEENGVELNENEPVKIKRQNSNENDNVLKIDWRNLMNLKLIPEDGKKEADKPELAKLNDQQPKTVDVAAH